MEKTDLEHCINQIDGHVNFIIKKYYYVSTIEIVNNKKTIKKWGHDKKRPVNSHIIINMDSDYQPNYRKFNKFNEVSFIRSIWDSASFSMIELLYSENKRDFLINESLPRSFPALFMFFSVWFLFRYINKKEQKQRRKLKESRDRMTSINSMLDKVNLEIDSLKIEKQKIIKDSDIKQSRQEEQLEQLSFKIKDKEKQFDKLKNEHENVSTLYQHLKKEPKLLNINNPYIKIDQFESDYIVFADTSSLMNKDAQKFFTQRIDSLISSNFFSPIFIVNDVIKELKKKSEQNSTSYVAKKALNIISSMEKRNKMIVLRDIGNFADHKFQVLLRERLQTQNICLITNDKSLAYDILNIENSKSVQYKYKMRVVTVAYNGDVIGEYLLAKEDFQNKLVDMIQFNEN